MTQFRHYSFDLWMTLIKSNPSFKDERAKYFFQKFNGNRKSLEEIKFLFRKVDLLVGAITEKTGSHIASSDLYLMALSEINEGHGFFEEVNLGELESDMETMALTYCPQLYSLETMSSLSKLKDKTRAPFSLLSNTAFIKGRTLRMVMERHALSQFFDFQLYSDEAGFSKPNRAFFNEMIAQARAIPGQSGLTLPEIIHVGDNPIADGKGAEEAGISFLLIHSNGKTILDLL